MKAGVLFVIMAAASAAGLCGCASLSAAAPQDKAASPLCAKAAGSLASGDYAELEAVLSDEMKEQMTRERFAAMVADLGKNGEVSSMEYLGELKSPVAPSELWVLTLRRRDSGGAELVTDKLLRIIVGNVGGSRRILGLVIQ